MLQRNQKYVHNEANFFYMLPSTKTAALSGRNCDVINSHLKYPLPIRNSVRLVKCNDPNRSVADSTKRGQVDEINLQGFSVSRDVIYCLLQGVTKSKDLKAGRQLHSLIVSNGFESVAVLGDHLIRLFALCGSLLETNLVFCKVRKPSVYTWQAILSAHAIFGENERALELYNEMQQEGIRPSKCIFLCILKACCSTGFLGHGRLIHEQIITSNLNTDVSIGNTLVDMYAKCVSLREARDVFNSLPNCDVVAWNVMIVGYGQHGHGLLALELFEKLQEQGIKPDKVTFLGVLKACSSIGAPMKGKLIHDEIIKIGLEGDMVIGNTLVDMYSKCGTLVEACKVFDELPKQNLVSWSAMIAGHVQQGHSLLALGLFQKMLSKGLNPGKLMFLCILKTCADIGALGHGRVIHDQLIRSGLGSDLAVGTAVIDMYAKCGNLDEAFIVFAGLPTQDAVLWGAMIAAYAQHGKDVLAGQCLCEMQQQGFKPDSWSYSSILAACSHMGKVADGYWYFKSMKEHHSITPTIEHFNCMVDLLGRAGHLNEAGQLLREMPVSPNVTGWTSLLTACKIYGNIDLGRECFHQVASLDPSYASGYILMSNIYADAHLQEDAVKIQALRKDVIASKKLGRACMEVDKKVYEFIVGDKHVPSSDNVYAKVKQLRSVMKEQGYVPLSGAVLQLMFEEEGKEGMFGEALSIGFRDLTVPVKPQGMIFE